MRASFGLPSLIAFVDDFITPISEHFGIDTAKNVLLISA